MLEAVKEGSAHFLGQLKCDPPQHQPKLSEPLPWCSATQWFSVTLVLVIIKLKDFFFLFWPCP